MYCTQHVDAISQTDLLMARHSAAVILDTPNRKNLKRRWHGLRVRFTPTIFSLCWLLVLVALEAVRVEWAGVELTVPRSPQCVCRLDICSYILHPLFGNGWFRVHVERPVDNIPRVARICRRAELVFVEQCGSNWAGRDLGQPPCEQKHGDGEEQ
eukprot:COSAG02_NODE_854_length_16499_cov_76.082561_13_plen_155_part_00